MTNMPKTEEELREEDVSRWEDHLQESANNLAGLCNQLEWGYDAVFDGMLTEDKRATTVTELGIVALLEECLNLARNGPCND